MKEYTFTVDGGRKFVRGKVKYPEIIFIDIPKNRVKDIIISLSNQIDREHISLDLMGSLEEDKPNDNS